MWYLLYLYLVETIAGMFWSSNRIDYMLEPPSAVEGLNAIPLAASPHVMHSRYWEAKEFLSFVLRQVQFIFLLCNISAPVPVLAIQSYGRICLVIIVLKILLWHHQNNYCWLCMWNFSIEAFTHISHYKV